MKKTCIDGNTAAAHVAYALSDISAIYPITPSSTMAELCDEWANQGRENIFGNKVKVVEMQSEAGAAGTVHGSLVGGALTTTFTASQGLLLMIPNMYKIAGELLPTVFHIAARTVSTHALCIFGDHSDVMACRGTGFGMLCSSSVQESMDLALVSHIAAINSSVPFLHFFDGFRTSHEIQKVDMLDYDEIKSLAPFDKISEFRKRALSPSSPHQAGTAQNPDIYFQNREASNRFYESAYKETIKAMESVSNLTGRKYSPFEYIGAKDADRVIVIMGSGAETVSEYVLNQNILGEKIGLVKVRLFRPFNTTAFVSVIPSSVKSIAVLDRTKECGAINEPLCQDVINALFEEKRTEINVVGGRYGLGGKEFTPYDVNAVFENLALVNPKNHFSVSIDDDVTNLSLSPKKDFIPQRHIAKEMKFFGLGSDGTISANKNSIKIIGETTDKFVQGYFEYDSKKSGSLTISHLRVSDEPIRSAYCLTDADFIACHNYSFITKYDILSGLKNGGTVLLNTILNADELNHSLPAKFVNTLKQKNAKLYIVNATKVAGDNNLGNKINVVMQTAFFKLSNVIDFNLALEEIRKATKKTYIKKGEKVVNANLNAINDVLDKIIEVDINKLVGKDFKSSKSSDNEYYENFIKPIEEKNGNALKVSAFNATGSVPTDTSKFEKRGIALECPSWDKSKCIQCGRCVMACPHSALKAVVTTENELKNKPNTFETASAYGIKDGSYRIQVSPLDCTGCSICSRVCPAKETALTMVKATDILEQERENFDFAETIDNISTPFPLNSPKGIQFKPSYFKFSGACAGCGETPYIKLATQLFGDRMVIANATGCSSIYGGSAPTCPYAKDKNGHGPAWANSLFEDNAEFGMGVEIATKNLRESLENEVEAYITTDISDKTKSLLKDWQDKKLTSTSDSISIIESIKSEKPTALQKRILSLSDNFVKKSIWIIGGDGWAYDIGYGGLDHVLCSNENVNILVLDTEVYSNTGGQASKSTPTGSIAKFAAGGKKTRKKDLGMIAMSGRNAYVASVSLGADMNQTIRAFTEAEAYDGPSIIICYCPCINHGINLANAEEEMKKAVQSGYWDLYRFNPKLSNSPEIDSSEPTLNYKDFLMGENRYRGLDAQNREVAEQLFTRQENESKSRKKQLQNFD